MENSVYDSMVVFDEALTLPDGNDGTTIYGLAFCLDGNGEEAEKEWEEDIYLYVQFLTGVKKWSAEGGTIEGKYWLDANNEPYDGTSPQIKEYCRQAYHENPIEYTVRFNCNPELQEEDLNNDWIIKNIIGEV